MGNSANVKLFPLDIMMTQSALAAGPTTASLTLVEEFSFDNDEKEEEMLALERAHRSSRKRRGVSATSSSGSSRSGSRGGGKVGDGDKWESSCKVIDLEEY